MNKRDLSYARKRIERLTKNASGSRRNYVKIEKGNTWEHELRKFKKAFDQINNDHHILSEVMFWDRKGKGDIIDLDIATVFEITKSETRAQVMRKAHTYPPELTIIGVDAVTGEEYVIRA